MTSTLFDYTIIHLSDNGEVLHDFVVGEDPYIAIAELSKNLDPEEMIIGYLAGHHEVMSPCDESGSCATAGDMLLLLPEGSEQVEDV
jgi:hypothetical protein